MKRTTALGVVGMTLLLIYGCSQSTPKNSSSQAPQTPTAVSPPSEAIAASGGEGSKLQQAFDFPIGGYLPKFEQIAGLPDSAAGGSRTYTVSGCTVSVFAEGTTVRGIGLPDITKECAVLVDDKIDVRELTLGQFDELFGPGLYSATCLEMCGNAADPSVFSVAEGSHVDLFINHRAEVKLVADNAMVAAAHWSSLMKSKEGEDYVEEGKYNCDHKYDVEAAREFTGVKITGFYVGEFENFGDNCQE